MDIKKAPLIFIFISFVICTSSSSAYSGRILTSAQLHERYMRSSVKNSSGQNYTESTLTHVTVAIGGGGRGGGSSSGSRSSSGSSDRGSRGSSRKGYPYEDDEMPSYRTPGTAGTMPLYAAGAAGAWGHGYGASGRNQSNKFVTLTAMIIMVIFFFGHAR